MELSAMKALMPLSRYIMNVKAIAAHFRWVIYQMSSLNGKIIYVTNGASAHNDMVHPVTSAHSHSKSFSRNFDSGEAI
jgi:hypothetical protein